MKEQYKNGGKPKLLVTVEYDNQIPELLKEECWGKRMMVLTSKCYYATKGGSSML